MNSSMNDRIGFAATELERIANDSVNKFGSLSTVQLNWKPGEQTWSVAQCFDHLITSHSLYFSVLSRLANGDMSQTFWERRSPMGSFFGNFLIRSLDPKNTKKMKTTTKGKPTASFIDGRVIDRFRAHQVDLIEHLRSIPSGLDLAAFKITSPLMGFVTYPIGDVVTFLPMHCQRHFNQAERVLANRRFPIVNGG